MVLRLSSRCNALPLTPNGKVDRRALPRASGGARRTLGPGGAAGRPEVLDEYEAPRSRVEVVLTRIWAEVLKLEHLGIHDNFFELGAIRCSRLARRRPSPENYPQTRSHGKHLPCTHDCRPGPAARLRWRKRL